MITLPRESKTATEIVAWWTSMPIYFSWLITALLSVGGDTNNHNLQQSGRLLYCVNCNRQLRGRISGDAARRPSIEVRSSLEQARLASKSASYDFITP